MCTKVIKKRKKTSTKYLGNVFSGTPGHISSILFNFFLPYCKACVISTQSIMYNMTAIMLYPKQYIFSKEKTSRHREQCITNTTVFFQYTVKKERKSDEKKTSIETGVFFLAVLCLFVYRTHLQPVKNALNYIYLVFFWPSSSTRRKKVKVGLNIFTRKKSQSSQSKSK